MSKNLSSENLKLIKILNGIAKILNELGIEIQMWIPDSLLLNFIGKKDEEILEELKMHIMSLLDNINKDKINKRNFDSVEELLNSNWSEIKKTSERFVTVLSLTRIQKEDASEIPFINLDASVQYVEEVLDKTCNSVLLIYCAETKRMLENFAQATTKTFVDDEGYTTISGPHTTSVYMFINSQYSKTENFRYVNLQDAYEDVQKRSAINTK